MTNDMTNFIQRLVDLLKLLSSSSDIQISYLVKERYPVDELGLDFASIFDARNMLLEGGWLTADQVNATLPVDQQLITIGGDEHLQTYEGMENSKEWEYLRKLAKEALKYFDTE